MISAAFVAARTPDRDIGVLRGSITRIVPAEEWTGEPALRLEGFFPGVDQDRDAARVIVVTTERGPRALSTSSPLVLRECAVRAVSQLPDELWGPRARPVISHVVIEDGEPPLLVLSPHAFECDADPLPAQGDSL